MYLPPLIFLFVLFVRIENCQPRTVSTVNENAIQSGKQNAGQMNNLSFMMRTSDPQHSLELAYKALLLAVAENNNLEIGRSYFNQGNALANMGKYTDALLKLDSAQTYFSTQGNQFYSSKVWNSKGVVYGNLGDYKTALEVHFKALKIRETICDSAGIPVSLNNLGIVYQQLGDSGQAISYYQQALALHSKRNDTISSIMTLSNIGALYASMQDFKNALLYHQQSLDLCQQKNDLFTLSSIFSNIGADLIELGDVNGSLMYQKKSLEIKQKLGEQAGEVIALLNIGQCYAELKQYTGAEQYLKKGLLLARAISYPEAEKNANFYLAELYGKMGNSAQELFYFKNYTNLKDSLFNEEKAKEIGKVEERYKIEKVLAENQRKQEEHQRLQQEQLSRRNKIQYTGIFIFIIILFFGAVTAGKFRFPVVYAKMLIFFTFLLFFEFTILLLEHFIELFSGNIPLVKLACNACIALVISPLHGYLEGKMKHKLIIGSGS